MKSEEKNHPTTVDDIFIRFFIYFGEAEKMCKRGSNLASKDGSPENVSVESSIGLNYRKNSDYIFRL